MENEKFDLEKFPTSVSAKRMLGYVTQGFYDKSYVGKWIYQVMGLEWDSARLIVEDLPNQWFPETATWGLMFHEIKWQLPVREDLSYEERRQRIYQKRDCRSPMTPYRMEEYLRNITGFEVHIADISDPGSYGFVAPHPNTFKVYFLGEGTLDLKLVQETLNALKQSHTTYSVNDRIEIILDNRLLEQFVLKNINMHWKLEFWHCDVLNGSWLLDGSVLLNNRRRYDLIPGMILHMKVQSYTEDVIQGMTLHNAIATLSDADLDCLDIRMKTLLYENIKESSKELYHIAIDTVSENLETGLEIHADVSSNTETIENSTVAISDIWRFDGKVLMDGSRVFNYSVIEEEL